MDEERRDGEGALLYLRQGGAGLLTEVTTRWEGWGGMSGGQRRCGWLFFWGGGGGGGWGGFRFCFVDGMRRGKWVKDMEEYMARTQTTRKSPDVQ